MWASSSILWLSPPSLVQRHTWRTLESGTICISKRDSSPCCAGDAQHFRLWMSLALALTQGWLGPQITPQTCYQLAKQKGGEGAGEAAQLVMCLPCKHKDLTLIPRIHIIKARHGGPHLESQLWGGGDRWIQLPGTLFPASIAFLASPMLVSKTR